MDRTDGDAGEARRQTLATRERHHRERQKPAWISVADVDAEARRKKYALSEEEYARKKASRVSKHIDEVRSAKYAQFDDALTAEEYAHFEETSSSTQEVRDEDERKFEKPMFDLDMALFWARRRADAARAAALGTAVKFVEAEKERRHAGVTSEVEELRVAFAQERIVNERLMTELEKKTKEIERLRSQLAKFKLNREKEEPPQEIYFRRPRTVKPSLEDELPLFAQLRRDEGVRPGAWFMKSALR